MKILDQAVFAHVSGGDCGCGGAKDKTPEAQLKNTAEVEERVDELVAMADIEEITDEEKKPAAFVDPTKPAEI